jgi:effector-binding domain-containing protein
MKKLLYVILGLIGIYLILALVGKSRCVVERSVVVNQPVDVVKKALTDHKFFHDKWSPWTEKDPAAVTNYIGNPGEIGHAMTWSSKVEEVGQGTLAIVAMNGDSIIEDLSFEGMGTSKAYYIVTAKDGGSNVTWGMDMKIGFFFRPIMMFMNMDKMIGPDYEKGLANLKKAMESMPAENTASTTYEVKEMEWPESHYVAAKRQILTLAEMAPFFAKNFPAIAEALGKEKIQPIAPPTSIYWSFDEKEMKGDLTAAFKVGSATKVKGWESYSFPAGKVLMVDYYGAYEKIGDAHMAIGTHMKEKGIKDQTAVFEEYVTDPMSEKDTAKWLTKVYYLLK